MRLDRFLTAAADCTRSQAAALIRRGEVCVDGSPVRDPGLHVDPDGQRITLQGRELSCRKNLYIMMNKPKGVVCATEDGDRTVIDLLPENLRRRKPFPCGRLDKNTTGLILITDNGPLSHRLLSPKSHVEKVYRYRVKFPLTGEEIARLEVGVNLGDFTTAPCRIRPLGDREGEITLSEGKFHQIKRMMESVHNQITDLSRISFAGIALDPALAPGEWRELSESEEKELELHGNSNILEREKSEKKEEGGFSAKS